MDKAIAQLKTPNIHKASSRASATSGVSSMLNELKTDFMSMLSPTANKAETQTPMSMLTRALNAFDKYASGLPISHALKFKKSLSLENNAELFLQYNDEVRQETINDFLENEY